MELSELIKKIKQTKDYENLGSIFKYTGLGEMIYELVEKATKADKELKEAKAELQTALDMLTGHIEQFNENEAKLQSQLTKANERIERATKHIIKLKKQLTKANKQNENLKCCGNCGRDYKSDAFSALLP